MVWLETMVEVSDFEGDQETPKPKKYRLEEDTSSLTDISIDDASVSEPEVPFKSPRTLLNASQSRRTTKKTYAEAVSGSGSEDEAEVKMRKKAAQQGSQEKHKRVVDIAPMVRSSARSNDLHADCSTLGRRIW